MKQKTFIVLVVCCIFVSASFFGAYKLGVDSNKLVSTSNDIVNYQRGWNDALNSTALQQQTATNFSYSQGYKVGYQAGLSAQNVTVP